MRCVYCCGVSFMWTLLHGPRNIPSQSFSWQRPNWRVAFPRVGTFGDPSGSFARVRMTWSLTGSRKSAPAKSEQTNQAGHKLELSGVHALPGGFDREECGAIDFGELAGFSGTRRPFHLKRVAAQRGRIAVALEGPRRDFLAALVLDAAKGKQSGARCQAGFFLEFAFGRGEFVLARIDLAFGHEPRTRVFVGPEWSAEMDQQDLQLLISLAEHENAGANFDHFCVWAARRPGIKQSK